MYTSAILLGLLPTVFAHLGLIHESVFGFNGDGYTLVEPLSGKSFDQWWFHGNLNTPKVATIANSLYRKLKPEAHWDTNVSPRRRNSHRRDCLSQGFHILRKKG